MSPQSGLIMFLFGFLTNSVYIRLMHPELNNGNAMAFAIAAWILSVIFLVISFFAKKSNE